MLSLEGFIPLILVVSLIVLFLIYRSRSKAPPSSVEKISPESKISSVPETVASVRRSRFSAALRGWIPLLSSLGKNRSKWEEILITSDLGPKLTDELLYEMEGSNLEPATFLKTKLSDWLVGAEVNSEPWKHVKPFVLFLVGVNGVGKTTSLCKIASFFKSTGRDVGVVGADTFRKAAIEQLQRGCEKVGADFFTIQGADGSEGADPSAVIFDGLKKWSTKDIVLIDTSGRLHSKKNLMEELRKMKRAADKSLSGAPHEIWMVIDATLGQNAVAQAKSFHEAVGLTGLVLTKMDGLSRGGTVFQLYQELKVPIRFLGVGEDPQDLEKFVCKDFIEDLFDVQSPNL